MWTSADRAGRQVTLLIPPFLLVFLGIIAEGCLDGCKVLPQIIVLFSLYKVHANKKALVQKEKSEVLLSCKVHKKPVNIMKDVLDFGGKQRVAEQKSVGDPFF